MLVSIQYRGGPEAWYEIRARGRIYRFPGSMYLHDALEQINEGVGGVSTEAGPVPATGGPETAF